MRFPRIIPFALVLLAFADVVRAQSGTAQPATSGTAAGNGSLLQNMIYKPLDQFGDLVDDSAEFPIQTRPFILDMPRAHLLGDWAGLLPRLADLGINPTLSYVSNIAGNVSGGRSQGVAYADNIGLQFEFDLKKLVGLDGGSFVVSMSQRDGTSLSQKFIGNTFTVQQVFGGQTFHLINVAYQQRLFDDRLEFNVGRISAGDDFFVSIYNYLFMQNGFDGNPVGVFFNSPGMTAYPNATWGGRIKVRPSSRTYVMAGIYNGDPSIRDTSNHGADLSLSGPVFAIAEAGYINNGLPGDSQYLGNYKAGVWFDNSTYTDFTTVGYSTAASTKRGDWGMYGMFDQIVHPFAGPGSNRGFGIFGSLLISPDQSVSQMPWFFTAGVACRGFSEARPKDTAGLGVVFGEFSSDLSHSQERQQLLDPTVGVQSNESVVELTYRFTSANGAAFIQPDLQYIIRPGATGQTNDALVLGCQIGVNF